MHDIITLDVLPCFFLGIVLWLAGLSVAQPNTATFRHAATAGWLVTLVWIFQTLAIDGADDASFFMGELFRAFGLGIGCAGSIRVVTGVWGGLNDLLLTPSANRKRLRTQRRQTQREERQQERKHRRQRRLQEIHEARTRPERERQQRLQKLQDRRRQEREAQEQRRRDEARNRVRLHYYRCSADIREYMTGEQFNEYLETYLGDDRPAKSVEKYAASLQAMIDSFYEQEETKSPAMTSISQIRQTFEQQRQEICQQEPDAEVQQSLIAHINMEEDRVIRQFNEAHSFNSN